MSNFDFINDWIDLIGDEEETFLVDLQSSIENAESHAFSNDGVSTSAIRTAMEALLNELKRKGVLTVTAEYGKEITLDTLISKSNLKQLICKNDLVSFITTQKDKKISRLLNDNRFATLRDNDAFCYFIIDKEFRNDFQYLFKTQAFRELICNRTFIKILKNNELKKLTNDPKFKALIDRNKSTRRKQELFAELICNSDYDKLCKNNDFINLFSNGESQICETEEKIIAQTDKSYFAKALSSVISFQQIIADPLFLEFVKDECFKRSTDDKDRNDLISIITKNDGLVKIVNEHIDHIYGMKNLGNRSIHPQSRKKDQISESCGNIVIEYLKTLFGLTRFGLKKCYPNVMLPDAEFDIVLVHKANMPQYIVSSDNIMAKRVERAKPHFTEEQKKRAQETAEKAKQEAEAAAQKERLGKEQKERERQLKLKQEEERKQKAEEPARQEMLRKEQEEREKQLKLQQEEECKREQNIEEWYRSGLLPDFLGYYEEAVNWFRKAAEQGHAKAQNELGDHYYDGRGVAKDYKEAVNWYRKAAKQGNAKALNKLGDCYEWGRGVAKDFNEALNWHIKAAVQGHAESQYRLGMEYAGGFIIDTGEKDAVYWFRKSAEQGYTPAQYFLADCYKSGYCGLKKDLEEAVNWFRKAAEQGDAEGQWVLANCYYNGEGVTKDYKEAVNWFRKAAEQGHVIAQNTLGDCYQFGAGVTQDNQEAVNWYRKAADKRNVDAQHNLGRCYQFGVGVTQDYKEAEKWFSKAAERGSELAKLGLKKIKEQVAEKKAKQEVESTKNKNPNVAQITKRESVTKKIKGLDRLCALLKIDREK